MAKEGVPRKNTKGNFRKPARKRGKLKDSLGAWKMSDEEEKRIFSNLKKKWKKTSTAIRTGKEKLPEDDQHVDKLAASLLKLKKAGKEPLVLTVNQTALLR